MPSLPSVCPRDRADVCFIQVFETTHVNKSSSAFSHLGASQDRHSSPHPPWPFACCAPMARWPPGAMPWCLCPAFWALGIPKDGGDSSNVQEQLKDVNQIQSSLPPAFSLSYKSRIQAHGFHTFSHVFTARNDLSNSFEAACTQPFNSTGTPSQP